jgi:hypothetical protein
MSARPSIFALDLEWEGFSLIKGVFGPKINFGCSEGDFRGFLTRTCHVKNYPLEDWKEHLLSNTVRFRFDKRLQFTINGDTCSYTAIFEGSPSEAKDVIFKLRALISSYVKNPGWFGEQGEVGKMLQEPIGWRFQLAVEQERTGFTNFFGFLGIQITNLPEQLPGFFHHIESLPENNTVENVNFIYNKRHICESVQFLFNRKLNITLYCNGKYNAIYEGVPDKAKTSVLFLKSLVQKTQDLEDILQLREVHFLRSRRPKN